MLVSRDWLAQYVSLEGVSVEELTDRLTMSGLNLEEFNAFGGDWVIDLEVTSNRPDCLGHLGVAREIAALLERELKTPSALPATIAESAADHVQVEIANRNFVPSTTRG